MLHEYMLYLSSGPATAPATLTIDEPGRRHRHDHPAHPLAADARPARPPGAARPHRPVRRGTSGPPARRSCACRSRGSRWSRSACSSTPSRRGDRSPSSSAWPSPRRRPARPDTEHGLGRALRLRRAAAEPARPRDAGGRSSRWSRPRCGTRARPRSLRPAGAGSSGAGSSRVGPRARSPAVPLLRWDRRRRTRGRRRRDDSPRRRVGGPLRHPQPRPARGRRPRGPWSTTGRRPPRRSASRSTTLVFARQVHGAAAALVGPDDRGRGTLPKTTPCPTPTSLSPRRPGSRWPSWWPTASRWRWSTPRPVSWRPSTPAGAARLPGPSATPSDAMTDCGADVERVRAFLGPAVHPDRYQVSDEVRPGIVRRGAARRPRPCRGAARWPGSLAGRPGRGQSPAARGRRCAERPHRRQRRHHRRRGLLQRPRCSVPADGSPCWPASPD